MSDTLVIHPKDDSTVMLTYVYEGKGFDVINDPDISKVELRKEIEKHSKIIMLGHGMALGLAHPNAVHYGTPGPDGTSFIIDDSFADLLRSKETISMWCNSDQYFRRNNISGFHTGMIISEPSEAYYILRECPLTPTELYENMVQLSIALRDCLDKEPLEMKRYILDHYNGDDSITRFNRDNIIVL